MAVFQDWAEPLCNVSLVAARSPLELFFGYVYRIGYPLIIVAGLLGNIASIVVCLSPRLRRIPSSLHLSALASYDSVVLLIDGLYWLSVLGANCLDTLVGCPLLSYILNVASTLSSWSVTAFTVERFVVVYYPLHRASVCTPKKARMIILLLIPFPLFINIPYFYMLGIGCGYCEIKREYDYLNNALGMLDTILSCLIPVVAIFTLNSLIVRRLMRETANVSAAAGNQIATGLSAMATTLKLITHGLLLQLKQPIGY